MKRNQDLRFRLVVGCILLALVASMAHAQNGRERGPIIAEVIIDGANSVSRDRLIPYLYTKKGQPYSDAIAREDFNRLADSHLCRPVSVRTEPLADGRMNVIFVVKEYRSLVKEVVYRHNKHVTTRELEGITRIHRGMPLDPALNRMACIEITQHLVKLSYLLANVTLLEGDKDDDERVVFNITEGHKVQVRSTSFVGQKELAGTDRLRTQIDTSRSFLGLVGTYQPEVVENDVTKLTEYYRNNGFLNAKVAREQKFSDDFRFVDVIFHIHEGTRYRVGEVAVLGSAEFKREALAKILLVKQGTIYNESVVAKDLQNLTEYGGWRGYDLDVKKIVTELPGRPGHVRVHYVVEHKQHHAGG